MASIPKKVTKRFSKEVGKFQRILKNAKDRDLNEADTVDIVNDILGSVFGFDKYTETTREFAIRGTYCDLAVTMDGKIKYFIEVKAVGLDLTENHLRQAVNYGANHGTQWVVLTNGIDWEIRRILLKDKVTTEIVGKFDFMEMNARKAEDQERLFLLCKEGLSKAAIEEYHERQQIINRFTIGAIIQEAAITDIIRRELRKMSQGLRVENSEIADIVNNEVLKREIVEGENAKQAASKYKKALNKLNKKKPKKQPAESKIEPPSPSLIENQPAGIPTEQDNP